MKFSRLGGLGWGSIGHIYQFFIMHDVLLDVYSASWKHSRPISKEKATFIGDNIHPETGLPYFNTYEEAVAACEDALEQLEDKLEDKDD